MSNHRDVMMFRGVGVKLLPFLTSVVSFMLQQFYPGEKISYDNSFLFPYSQAGSDVEYGRWVKTLAVELMRQTPLDAVRFLDILGITATIATRGFEDETEGESTQMGFRKNYERGRAKRRVCVSNRVPECVEKRHARAQSSDPVRKMSDSDSELEDVDEKEIMALLRRCQQVDSYVPVREKRRLFESLCRQGRRLAQSSDNLCSAGRMTEVKLRRRKRARSLHDLSRSSSVAVKEICQYFETRGQLEQDDVRLHKEIAC